MASRSRAAFTQIALVLLVLSPAVTPSARADDLTGMAQDDPKDLMPSQPTSAPCYNPGFLPLPYWARSVIMSPLPDVLTPMGRKAVLTTPPVAALQPLAPPKDSPATVIVARPTVVAPTPATNPALIAVSPFLDWIRANPQAAADQARQQASTYQSGANVISPSPVSTPNNGSGPIVTTPAPYWMPPLIDSAPFTSSTGTSGSSAAIYSTPQR